MLSNRGHKFKEIGYQHGAQASYDPDTNPTGTVDFLNAENYLIQDELIEFINAKECCNYGEGDTGTLRLRKAMAKHLNEYFQPVTPLDAEDFVFAAGVTEINEIVAMLACDAHCADAVLIGRPNYGSFTRDMVSRGGIGQVFVDFHQDVDQFSPAGVDLYAQAYEKAEEDGHKIRALIISNPNNPLGQCYTRAGLIALMEFCQTKQIHLISDEIYGLSTYARTDRPAEVFVSVYAVDIPAHIDPKLVHVMYGLSKDYGAAGLRLGCLITHNADFASAARGLCRFSSPSRFSMSLAADLLEDRAFLKPYLAKSVALLSQARLVAEQALDEAGLDYHRKGNAGLFIWLDLRAYLPRASVTGEDVWAAEKRLFERIRAQGVALITGRRYHAREPGYFRLLFSMDPRIVREGIRRIKAACLESR